MMKELKKDLGCLCIMTVVAALAIGLMFLIWMY